MDATRRLRCSSSTTTRRSGCSAASTSSSTASRARGGDARRSASAPWPPSGPALVFLDVHLGTEDAATSCSTSCAAAGIPVVLVTGTADLDRVPRTRPTRCSAKPFEPTSPLVETARRRRLRLPVVSVDLRPHARPSSRRASQRYLFERSEEGRAVRVGEKETSEQAEIVRRYADLFSREQLEALREAEEARRGRRARAALPAAQDVRGRARLGRSSSSARTSSRTACSPSASPSRARRCRCGTRRRSWPCSPRTPTARSSGEIQADASAPFNADRLELIAAGGGALRRATRASPTPVERNEEEKGISLRELSAALKRGERRRRPRAFDGAARRAGSSSCSAPSARTIPSSYHTAYMRRLSPLESTYTKERATEVCLATLTELGFDLAAAAEHQARPRRPPAEGAARVRDRERPAERRAPDHARAGRPARLPGVPARGRPRAALRRRATRRCRTRSAASRATTR